MTEETVIDAAKPGFLKRIPRRIRIATLVVAIGGLVVWNIFPPDVPNKPIVLAREADGTLREQGGEDAGALAFNAHLGELKSQNSTSSVSSSGHSNPAFFAARHLIIINQSDDVLMERVGVELLDQLKQLLAVDRLEYYPFGHMPELGGLAPDFYVTLKLKSKEVSGLINDKLDATVKSTLGSTPANSSFSSFDDLTPPIVRLHASVEVRHQSTYFGVESSSAVYVLQGRDIAKQIASQLKTKFDEARADHGALPEIPIELANPEYSPIPEFKFLDQLGAKVVTSAHRLMTPNETFWRLTTDKTTDELFGAIKSEFVDSGWRLDHEETSFPRSAILRFVDRPRVLMIFPADRDELPRTADEPQPEHVDYFVHYRDRVSSDVLESAIEQVLEQPKPDVNFLVAFHGRGSSSQRGRIISLLEEESPGTIAIWSKLADHYSSRKDIEGCRRALRMLTCLKHLSSNGSSIENKIRNIAKKQKIDESEFESPTRDDWLTLGLVEMTEDGLPEPIEFGLGTCVGFFDIGEDGKVWVYSIVINDTGTSQLEAVRMKCSGGSRSWSSGEIFNSSRTTDHHSFGRGQGQGRVELTTEKLSDDRFLTTLRPTE
jgi:hypothetical protein